MGGSSHSSEVSAFENMTFCYKTGTYINKQRREQANQKGMTSSQQNEVVPEETHYSSRVKAQAPPSIPSVGVQGTDML